VCDGRRPLEREISRGWSVLFCRPHLRVSDDQAKRKPSADWVPGTMSKTPGILAQIQHKSTHWTVMSNLLRLRGRAIRPTWFGLPNR